MTLSLGWTRELPRNQVSSRPRVATGFDLIPELIQNISFLTMVRRVKRNLSNIWQFVCVVIFSISDKSVELHLPWGREIQTAWPGDVREVLFCIGSLTVPINRLKFSGMAEAGSFSEHPKYQFFQRALSGMPLETDPYFLGQNFSSREEEQLFLARKSEILRLATEGQKHFDICGIFLSDGSLGIVDGEHRILALAALGKRQLRLGIVLEN